MLAELSHVCPVLRIGGHDRPTCKVATCADRLPGMTVYLLRIGG